MFYCLTLPIDCKPSGSSSKNRNVWKLCVCVRACIQMMWNTCYDIMWRGPISFYAAPGNFMCVSVCFCVGTPVCCKCWQLNISRQYDTAVLQNCSTWPFVKSRAWSTNCEPLYFSNQVQSALTQNLIFKFHFNNILQYAQYCNWDFLRTHSDPWFFSLISSNFFKLLKTNLNLQEQNRLLLTEN